MLSHPFSKHEKRIRSRFLGGIASVCTVGVAFISLQTPHLMATMQSGKNADFSDWPSGAEPAEIGERVAREWLGRPFHFEVVEQRSKVIYPEVCTWYGAMEVARQSGNDEILKRLVERYNRFRVKDAQYVSQKRHVDDSIFGVIPLELYLITGDEDDRAAGLHFADRQWEHPDENGLSEECRFWIDDLFMLPILQVQAFRATRDPVYLDRAARTMASYLDVLQQPNGLFFHAPDSPFFWGRGNGWVAAGMAELLRELPESNEHYATVLAGYHRMMTSLAGYQASDGRWRQLIDDPESWEESSCTGMFTFAMITGVKLGLLEPDLYAPFARKGWLALVQQLDGDAQIQDVCVGTNKGAAVAGDDLKLQREFYLARPKHTGDLHGQAPVLWCAAALMR